MQLISKEKRQLNPFALAAETNIRFTLLIFAAMILAWAIGVPLINKFKLNRLINVSDFMHQYVLYMKLARSDLEFSAGKQITPKQMAQLDEIRTVLIIWRKESIQWLLLSLILPFIVLLLTWIFFLFHPYLIRYRKKSQRFLSTEDPDFYAEIVKLSKLAGISVPPTIEIDRSSKTLSGQAYGHKNPYILSLGGRMRLLFRRRSDEFRTIILHELAHIANRDIQQTYMAQSIWIIVVIFVFTPEIINQFSRMFDAAELLNHLQLISSIARYGATLMVIRVIGNGLVQTRELYADWRVAILGMGKQLEDILQRRLTISKSSWTTFWTLHPPPQKRLAALRNPRILFEMNWEIPIIAGTLIGLSLDSFLSILIYNDGIFMTTTQLWYHSVLRSLIATNSGNLDFASIIILLGANGIGNFSFNMLKALAILPITLMVSGTLGVQQTRASIADLEVPSRDRGYFALVRPAFLVALGTVFGFAVAPNSNFYGINTFLQMIGFTFYCIFVFTIVTWFWLIFVRYFSRQILGSYTGKSIPNLRHAGIILLSALLLCLVYPIFLLSSLMFFASFFFQYQNYTQADLIKNMQALPYDALSNIIALIILMSIILLILFMVKLFRRVHSPRCSSCSSRILQRYAVGQNCVLCGKVLAPWLYLETP